MGKNEKGTPKEIANRCKSKGLQKLKWFCQMCSKQCRDQNGFKCHLTSESHQRQLLLFAENQNAYLREFSREFEGNFMHILRHTFGTKRVRANEVYQDYIKEKGHVHMNSTVWHTLTGFVLYLGSSGKCKIDENEKGWHIQYIDKEEEMRKQKMIQKVKQEKDDEDRMNEMLQRQIEKAQQKAEENGEDEKPTISRELQRDEGELVKFALGTASKIIKQEINEDDVIVDTKPDIKPSLAKMMASGSKKDRKKSAASSSKRSALEELRDEEESFKEKKNRKNYWIQEGIIVKLVSKKYGSSYYKEKFPIIKVFDKFTAELDIGHDKILEVSQDDLETVIPAIGKEMLILNGANRDDKATLLEILEGKFLLRLKIKQGVRNGRIVEVSYEDACKTIS